MAKIESWFVCDLKKAVQVQVLNGNVFSLDNNGSRIGVKIFDGGEKATVSGAITANCVLPDGSTVNVNGTLTTVDGQSVGYIDVPQGCLLITGPLKITIKLTDSGVITTLAAILTTVYQTKTDNVITPSAQIINDWNAEISAAIATQNAAIANQDTKINDLKSAVNIYKRFIYDTGTSASQTFYSKSFRKGAIIDFMAFDFSEYTSNPSAIHCVFRKVGDSTNYDAVSLNSNNNTASVTLSDDYDYVLLYRNASTVNMKVDVYNEVAKLNLTRFVYGSSSSATFESDNKRYLTKGNTVYFFGIDFSQETAYDNAFDIGFLKTGDSTIYQRVKITSQSPIAAVTLTDNYNTVRCYRNESAVNATINIVDDNPLNKTIVEILYKNIALIEGDSATVNYTGTSSATKQVSDGKYLKSGTTVYFHAYHFSKETTNPSAISVGFKKSGSSSFYQTFSIVSATKDYSVTLEDDYSMIQFYRNESDVNCSIDVFTVLGVKKAIEYLTYEYEALDGIIKGNGSVYHYTSSSGASKQITEERFLRAGTTVYIDAINFNQEPTTKTAIQCAFMKTGDATFYHLFSINAHSKHFVITLDDNYNYFQTYRNESSVNCDIVLSTVQGLINGTKKSLDEIDEIIKTDITIDDDLQSKYFKGLMKVGVIGDSLSTGHIENGHSQTANTIIYGWPRQIMQDTQGVWKNYGFSGASTRSWLSSENGWAALSNSGKCQVYIIGLCVNDSASSVTPPQIPLGTIEDIDPEDYTQNADTFYGNYGKILSKVHEYAPQAKFILLTSPRLYNSTWTPQFNQAIRDIAALDYWGSNTVFLCDLRNDYMDLFNSDAISSQSHGWHYTAEGYASIAKMMQIAISDTMRKNSAFALIDEIEYELDQ